MAKQLCTYPLSEPFGDALTAKVNIDVGDGNVKIDSLGSSEPLLASGELEYLEKQQPPARSLIVDGGRATLSVKASGRGQSWLRLPWAACNGATEWRIHLTPRIPMEITAYTAGGNVKIDLSGMVVSSLTAETGGGNVEVTLPKDAIGVRAAIQSGGGNIDLFLPENAAGLSLSAKTGAGNLNVHIPSGTAARITATSGWGKVIIGDRFVQIDKHTYQSPDYDNATKKMELTLGSGAGNVTVEEQLAQPATLAGAV